MKSYPMQAQDIPVYEYDVIVVGGGPAGCTAAAAAAREGGKTLLIEASGALGGMGTIGMVPAWCPFSDKEKIIYKGLAEKIFWKAREGVPHLKDKTWVDWVPIDFELLKRVYDDLMLEYGVDVLFNTMIVTAEAANGRVDVVIAANRAGLSAFRAKVFVDCTGDADIVARAGGEFVRGGDSGQVQGATLCFTLSNVDQYHYDHGERMHSENPNCPIHQIVTDEKYNFITDPHFCNNTIGPGTIGFNAGHLFDVDCEDVFGYSKAIMQGRKKAAQYQAALAEYVPQTFGAAFLSQTAQVVGIREGRRIIGDYILTYDDFVAARTFDDEIGRNSYYIDMHGSDREEAFGHVELKKVHYEPGESHGIPYRCLTPKGIQNVLVAGRSISCDKYMQASLRVMPPCLVTGEAAGMAAAIAAQDETPDVHAVDCKHLQKRLLQEGAYLHADV